MCSVILITLQEIIDILAEIYEEIEDGDNEIWEETEMIWEDLGGMARSYDADY